ncbi:translocation/assembly module TamB domain-containing protein [Flavobacterium sp. Fl-77]|uniref:Translocation/assembly module TamB domain-containing protein n=1 Tax=Flavobacterium flavipigmentatum TaxID=2893884 RepID=A0AAJ2S8Z2_9FLAO|nr:MULTISPECIES: translocation/assembly module TamB [unclassified Flavobacterium]MDX6183118.1 translocation/assembly module TamB domain-containing protein [Flavobacterium sp. Fl-33]MDX6186813.1 translocation/assembly module TamB domain-containing protein [Flavobacterium sp. Fl-77]UFH40467.1 translocation/assembly module TamB [Flavobacterium sp. F-70]
MNSKSVHYLKKTVRVLLWCLASITALLLLLTILIQVPSIQNYAKDKAITYLQKKIKTKVSLDRIAIHFPKEVVLEGFYFEDQNKDTLLSGKTLELDIDLFKLISSELEINSISLQNTTANISRNKDGVFNFDYIIKAFESKEQKEKDPDSKPFTISVVNVNLDNIKFNFKDDFSKNDIKVKLRHFDTKFQKFDLDKMSFDIPNINLNGLQLVLDQDAVEKIAEASVNAVDTISKRKDFNLKLGKISLSKIDITYDNKDSKLDSGIKLGNLDVAVNKIDLNNQLLDFDVFELKNLKGNLRLGTKDKQIRTPNLDSTSIKQVGWKVKLNKAELENIAFKFDDMHSKPAQKGIDYSHLDLHKFNFKAEKLYYGNDTISGNIKSLTVNEKSGLAIQSLKTDFFYGPKNAYLNNLYLRTPQTLLRDNIKLRYQSITTISKNIDKLVLDANLKQSKIGFKDVLLFVPDLQKQDIFRSNPNAILFLDSRLSGKVSDLNIQQFEMKGIGTTRVSLSGKIKGMPDIEKAYFDLNIKKLQSSAKDVTSFVPKGTIPDNIQLPAQFNLQGKLKGGIQNFKTNLTLNSSFGYAKVDALFDQRIKKNEKYDATVYLLDFDLGKLIKNDSIGKISLKAKVKGKGLDPKTAQAELDGLVQKAVFNKYTYRDLAVKGSIANGAFEVKSGMKDPNLHFDLVASGNTKEKYPSGKMKLNLDIADLEKLHLHAGPMKLRGNIDADITNSNPDFLNGKVFLSNIQILQSAAPIVLDSVKIIAVADDNHNNIKVSSQFLKAELDGKYKLTTLSNSLQKSLSKYIDLGTPKSKTVADDQNITLNLSVENDPILFRLIPNLTSLEPIKITGKYNSVADSLEIKGAFPRIVYANTTISDGKMKVEVKEDAINYQLSVATIESGSLKIPYTSLTGKAANNELTYALEVKDTKEQQQYFIAGELLRDKAKNTVKFDAQNFVLNYDKWNLNADNSIEFGGKRLYINKLYLDHSGNELKIQSQGNQDNAPLQIDFVNFKIETILNMVKKEKLLMQGLINGSVLAENVLTKPTFTSDLKIDEFAFKGEPVGNITVKVDNKTNNTLAANVNLSGEGNDVNLLGDYKIDTGNFDLNLDISHLNIKSIQGFSMDNIKEGSGFLSGNFKVTGNAAAPKVAGELQFNDAGFRITQLNSYLKTNKEKITFRNDVISFDKFSFYDENDNELFVNGTIGSSDFRNFNFALLVEGNDFRAIHSKAADNDLFYGDLFLDTKLNIKGTLESPVIGGTIKINKETKFTVVLPQSDPSIADREGIVEFVDEDNIYLKQTVDMQNKLNQSELKGMDVSVAISIDKEAELTLVIDKGNGDYLNLKGEAELTGGIDPSGKTTLTGKYEFSEGAYEMNFNMIRRKFDIQKGSYIIWNGEPTMANLNITAIYKVGAAPIDLLGNQLGTMSPTEKNTFKQKIPFQTHLKMNGELLKPEITFDIVLPDGNYGVASNVVDMSRIKLEQLRQEPAEMNKQVFALLLLNRFIGENPFASESGGTSAESLARQSVSKILSQQLNDFAGELIKGVQLEFDLESTEDYTSGSRENRTDLNVGVSKKLLNDRLKVTVGSSFGVEGQERANEQSTNIAGDVALDYQLTKDGRYMVRAYRKNEYQVAVEGQVVETGVAFIITMSYNKFSELFHRSEAEKEMIRQEKLQKQKRKLKEKTQENKEDQIEGNEQKT